MNETWISLETWLDPQFCTRLAMTLVHFLWQGLLIGAVVCISTFALASHRATARYQIGLLALFAMLLCLPLTYAYLASADLVVIAAAASRAASFGIR